MKSNTTSLTLFIPIILFCFTSTIYAQIDPFLYTQIDPFLTLNSNGLHYDPTYSEEYQAPTFLFDQNILIGNRTDYPLHSDSLEIYFDADRNLDYIVKLLWIGIAWEESSKTHYTYDQSGNQTQILYEYIINNGWIKGGKDEFKYDDNNNLTSHKFYFLVDNQLTPFYEEEYIFNNNNQLSEYYYHENSNNIWQTYFRDTISYNSVGQRTELVRSQLTDGEYQKSEKTRYNYDTNNNLVRATKDLRDENNVMWDPYKRVDYGYDDQSTQVSLSVFGQIVNQPGLQLTYKREKVFNNEGLLDSVYYGEWDNSELVLAPRGIDIYTYDNRENISAIHSKEFVDNTWNNLEQRVFYYDYTSSTTGLYTDTKDIQIYPNPNNGVFDVELKLEGNEEITMSVYSIDGALQSNQKILANQHHKYMNLNHLTSGIYILKLSSEDWTITEKLVIKK